MCIHSIACLFLVRVGQEKTDTWAAEITDSLNILGIVLGHKKDVALIADKGEHLRNKAFSGQLIQDIGWTDKYRPEEKDQVAQAELSLLEQSNKRAGWGGGVKNCFQVCMALGKTIQSFMSRLNVSIQNTKQPGVRP
ncbi:MAG: hypothetical protein R6V55_15435 [Desulfovermiculus sp.]